MMGTRVVENKVFVDLSVNQQYNNDGDEGGGRWSYQGSYSAWLESVTASVARKNGYFTYAETFEVPFQPIPGTAVFVVTAKYQTGGTFGHEERYIPVAVFNDPNKAFALSRLIESNNREFPNSYEQIEFEGYSIYSGTWKGYFEHLIDVDVHTVMLEA